MKTVDLSFDGCYRYEQGDTYEFTSEFDYWWTRELKKRVKNYTAFVKQHGKGWYLLFDFCAGKHIKQAGFSGPEIQRNTISDPPHHRKWSIDIPSFRFQSPNTKAYVPLMRQFLAQFVLVLEREGIDASKVKKDSPLLLKQFARQTGMLERNAISEYLEEQEAQAKKEHAQAKDSASFLKTQSEIVNRLKNLRRKYKLKFSVAFDAKGKGNRSTGWQADYAVVDLTVAGTWKNGTIPDNLYENAIEIFRHAEKTLQRSRTFFVLRLVPRLNKYPWSVALFLSQDNLATEHAAIRKAAAEFLWLTVCHSVFKKEYADYIHALCGYSHKERYLFAFPSECAITFNEHITDSDNVEKALLAGRCDQNITGMTEVYLGNSSYWHGRIPEAIKQWERSVKSGVTEALYNIASGYCQLGQMQEAYDYCKRGILRGANPDRVNDPDLAKFRKHPLFAKIKALLDARLKRPRKPLSPKWSVPKNLKQLVEEGDGMWDDDRWSPIILTVMSGTSYLNRKSKIPFVWQLEFDPFVRRFAAASKRLKAMSIHPGGDEWSQVIEREFATRHPEFAGEFDDDSESSTCVVVVKSEKACEKLLELIWSMMNLTIAFP